MASKQNAKKDINYIINEIVSDCFIFLQINSGKEEEKIVKILNEVVEVRNNLIYNVNHPPKDKKEIKKHYKNIFDELSKTLDSSIQKLGEIAAS